MADEGPKQKSEEGPNEAKDPAPPPPDSGRARRAPPTIRLRATELFNETRKAGDAAMESGRQQNAGADAASADSQLSAGSSPSAVPGSSAEPKFSVEPEPPAQSAFEKSNSEKSKPERSNAEKPAPEQIIPEQPAAGRYLPETEKPKAAISPWVVAPISGAVAAALVIGVGWMLGWPPVQRAEAPQANAATIDALAGRVGGLEARLAKPTEDPAEAARIAALEKSFASLREQSDKLAAQVDSVKSAPPAEGAAPPAEGAAPAVDLSAITQRLNALESAGHSEAEPAKSDDLPLRRVVMASLLDLSVRQGEPFEATLAAAKGLAPDADALKPLEGFASTGVPTAAHLSRELFTLLPKLSPPAPEGSAASNLVDRLQAGAQRLVRIQRGDATGTERDGIVARVTAAALHNDFNDARRELNTLAPADRAPVQSWIDQADARDAALAAAHQFAADAMAAFAKPTP